MRRHVNTGSLKVEWRTERSHSHVKDALIPCGTKVKQSCYEVLTRGYTWGVKTALLVRKKDAVTLSLFPHWFAPPAVLSIRQGKTRDTEMSQWESATKIRVTTCRGSAGLVSCCRPCAVRDGGCGNELERARKGVISLEWKKALDWDARSLTGARLDRTGPDERWRQSDLIASHRVPPTLRYTAKQPSLSVSGRNHRRAWTRAKPHLVSSSDRLNRCSLVLCLFMYVHAPFINIRCFSFVKQMYLNKF
jgi:hypothetical protein